MTKDEFKALSAQEQNTFINNGGVIDEISVGVMGVSPTVEEQKPLEFCGDSPKPEVDPSPSVPHSFVSEDKFDGLTLWKNPVEMLFAIDPDISSGEVQLHAWQVQFMLDFARTEWNQDSPFQAVVRACNGSGKDLYVIAACAVWVCMRYKSVTAPVTSSSGFQLDNQTCKHTRRKCEEVNRFFGIEVWDCKYRNYTFHFDFKDNEFNSQILCYATDEPGKAEGFHPVGKGRKMCIFCSEDKTIPDEINDAINKCSGYTHRVHASTPGKSFGHFYDYCNMAIKRSLLTRVTEVGTTDWIEYHITSDMCPHLPKDYKEKAAKNIPGGAASAAYKSQVDAEFGGDDGEMVVIPFSYIWQSNRKMFNTEWFREDHNTGGFDSGDGGAESALTVRNGNKHIITIGFKFKHLISLFKDYELDHPKSRINGDCVGIGKIILDQLRARGWKNVRYLDSRASASRPSVFKNRNAEIWFNVRQLFTKHEIIKNEDRILDKQLGSRHYKLIDGKIHQMLSKKEEFSKGFPSPDRADSFNYCFWNYESKIDQTSEECKAPFEYEEPVEEETIPFSLIAWAKDAQMKHKVNTHVSDLSELREDLDDVNKLLLSSKE